MHLRNSRRSYIALLILLCGDVESCPGPISAQISSERIIDKLMSLLEVKGLKILHQNTRGLTSNFAYILELFQSFNSRFKTSSPVTNLQQVKFDDLVGFYRVFNVK